MNIKNPESIENLHKEYIKAGAEIITTNSFSGHPLVLREWGEEKNAFDINLNAARIAKKASSTPNTSTSEQEEKIRTSFLKKCQGEQSTPRSSAFIVTKGDHRPLGWVNSYQKESYPSVAYVGISICEDAALNRGLGSEALKLWID